MKYTKPYYLAETAFHHEGNVDFLIQLINDINELEIDAIKFHLLLNLDDYIIKTHPAIEVLSEIMINQGDWLVIFEHVAKLGKEIVLLCNDLESVNFVNSIQDQFPIVALELHSTGLNDIYLLEQALNFQKTIILGIGGSTFDEIQYAVDYLTTNNKTDLLLMHGFQNYPTNYEDINLKRINFLKEAFNFPFGYADHTDPLDSRNEVISTLPIMLGVNVIEKHITNLFGQKRIDAQAAISTATMKSLIDLGNTIFQTLGTKAIVFSDAELNYGNTGPMKKALVARKPIAKGEVLTRDHIAFKRTESESTLMQKDYNKVLGAIAIEDIEEDQILSFSNVEYSFKKPSFEQFFIKK